MNSAVTTPSRRVAALVMTGVVAFGGLALVEAATAPTAHAADVVVYDSIPSPLPANVASVGFQATKTSEMGDLIELAPGTSRALDRVRVGFSSWACETGTWSTGDCATTPGATFEHPVTVTLYEAGADGSVGAVVASVTHDLVAPFRPSPDAVNCPDDRWFDGASCSNGILFVGEFDFSGASVVLPDRVIVGVAFNTRTVGAEPLGVTGPYDALNVAVAGAATTGTDLDADVAYLKSTTPGNYADGGAGGVDVFRADTGWAANGAPMLAIVTDAPSAQEPPTTTPSAPASAEDAIAQSGATLPASTASSGVTDSERTVTLDLGPAYANQWYYVVAYSEPTVIGWVWVGPTGSVTFPLPDTLPAGTHTIALLDASGNVVAHVPGVSVAAVLAATGLDTASMIVGGALGVTLLLLGGVIVLGVRRARAAH